MAFNKVGPSDIYYGLEYLGPFPSRLCRDADGRLWYAFGINAYLDAGETHEVIRVVACYSDDDGNTWTEEVAATLFDSDADPGYIHYSQFLNWTYNGGLALSINGDGDVLVAWASQGFATNPDDYTLNACIRSGDTWGTAQVIDSNIIPSGAILCYGLFADVDESNKFHLLWGYAIGGTVYIYYSNKVSGSWLARETVYSGTDAPAANDFRIDADNCPIAIYEHRTGIVGGHSYGDIYYKKRIAGIWQAEVKISNMPAVANAWAVFGNLAVDDAGIYHFVYVAKPDGVNYNIYYNNLAAEVQITNVSGQTHWEPHISLDRSGVITIAWACTGYGTNPAILKTMIAQSPAFTPTVLDDTGTYRFREANLDGWLPKSGGLPTNRPTSGFVVIMISGPIWAALSIYCYSTATFSVPQITNISYTAKSIVTLEALRNIEMSALGRVYVDEEGRATYKSRYARNR